MTMKQDDGLLDAWFATGDDAEKPATGDGEWYVPTLQQDDTVKWRLIDLRAVWAAIAAIWGQLAAKAPLFSPNFIGTVRVNGAVLSTSGTADLAEVQAGVSALNGLVASKAPLVSPNLLGTPTKNGVPLATTADITGGTPDSDQIILASQIFGA